MLGVVSQVFVGVALVRKDDRFFIGVPMSSHIDHVAQCRNVYPILIIFHSLTVYQMTIRDKIDILCSDETKLPVLNKAGKIFQIEPC